MADAKPELIMFRRSHFNEKVRWALDYKGIAHTRRPLLPGPHARTMMKLTGQRMVPAVRFGETVVHDSSRIIDELERRFPEPALYPNDPLEREQALEIQDHFDGTAGPGIRAALFSTLLDHPGYASRIFADHLSPFRLALYAWGMRFGARAIKRELRLGDPEVVRRAFDDARAGLDYVVKHAGPEGYLVGSSFSVADLAAAALLTVATEIDHPDMALPKPLPAFMQEWRDQWSAHPGTEWVREIYRRHRPQSRAD